MGKTKKRETLTTKDTILIILLLPVYILVMLGLGLVYADLMEAVRKAMSAGW